MRGVWIAIVVGLAGVAGCCTNTPKREMRQHVGEEFPTIPAGEYLTPRQADRTEPILVPKGNSPGLNTPGLGGPGGPGGPSTGPGMSPGGMRK